MSLKTMLATLAGAVLIASPLLAQAKSKNAPDFVKSAKAPGLDVRYLDFKWDEAAFDAMENGGDHPAAQRSWVLARLMLQRESLKWGDSKRIPVGSALLILNPRKGATGLTFEIRHVDMREIFTDMNVIAEPPPDVTYRKAPVTFTKVDTLAPNLEVGVQEKGNAYDLTVHYGNRQATITLTR
jgi:hypothetical protein